MVSHYLGNRQENQFKVSLDHMRPWAYVGGGQVWTPRAQFHIITGVRPGRWICNPSSWEVRPGGSGVQGQTAPENYCVSKPQAKIRHTLLKCWNDHLWLHHQVLPWFLNSASSRKPRKAKATQWRKTRHHTPTGWCPFRHSSSCQGSFFLTWAHGLQGRPAFTVGYSLWAALNSLCSTQNHAGKHIFKL